MHERAGGDYRLLIGRLVVALQPWVAYLAMAQQVGIDPELAIMASWPRAA